MKKTNYAAALMLGLFAASSAQAASLSFYLNQSNKLDDDVNYLQVTIADGIDGAIDFTVQALQPLLDAAGDKFGIQKFGFNLLPGSDADRKSVDALPDEWKARNGGRFDGFGWFDIRVQGNGNSRADPLTFSITGIDFDTLENYIALSTGSAKQGHSLFAAKVGGFKIGCDDERELKTKCVRNAFFGGGPEVDAVPAPPAVWLMGTAVAALVARRMRKRLSA